MLDSAPEMKILQGGAKSTEPSDDRSYLLVLIAIVLVSDRQRKEVKNRSNAINVTLHLFLQAVGEDIKILLWRKIAQMQPM